MCKKNKEKTPKGTKSRLTYWAELRRELSTRSCVSEKLCFESETQAENYLYIFRKRNNIRICLTTKTYIYKCSSCGFFHYTRQEGYDKKNKKIMGTAKESIRAFYDIESKMITLKERILFV